MKWLGGYAPLFRSKGFLLLWLSGAISSCGDAVYRVALLLLVTGISKSPLALAAVVATQTAVGILLGPIAGVLADRYPRPRLMLLADATRLVALLVMARVESLSLLFPLVMVLAAAGALFNPARLALVPDLVGQQNYVSATSLHETTSSVVCLVGPALGGILIAYHGLPAAFLLDAATFAISVVALVLLQRGRSGAFGEVAESTFAPIDTAAPAATQLSSIWSQFKQGLRAISARPSVVFVISLLLPVMIALGALNVLQIDYLRNVLLASPEQVGFVESVMFAGSLLSTFLLGLFGQRLNKGRLLLTSIVLMGLATSVFLLQPSLLVVYGWAFFLGASDGLMAIPFYGIVVNQTAREVRGRVMSCFDSLMRVGMLVGLGISGAAAVRFGSNLVIGFAGLGVLLVGIAAHWHPRYAALVEGESPPGQLVASQAN